MKFVAFLRGINVGGKSAVSMTVLKEVIAGLGYEDVGTYINSGNVFFEAEDKIEIIADKIEKALLKAFGFEIKVVVRSKDELRRVIKETPDEWRGDDLRCYIAFIRPALKPEEVFKELRPREGVDSVKVGDGVLYLSTKLSGITKTGFTKMAGTPVYREMTMRNLNTVQKIFKLLED